MDSRRARIKAVSSAIWLRVFVAVVCLAMVVLEGWRDWNERNDVLDGASRVMVDLAQSLAQHAEDTFELADATLIDITDRIASIGASPDAVAGLEDAFAERIKSMRRFKSLLVFGEDGNLIGSSLPGHRNKFNGSHLALFRHHKGKPDAKWFFGPLIQDPIGSDWVLTLSRRFDKLDGTFGGVVMITIPPRYFSNFYAQFDIGTLGSISLLTTKGIVLSRYPYQEDVIGRDASSSRLFRELLPHFAFGSYSYKASLDGVERISGYRRNHVFPVVVVAAVGRDEVLANWNRTFLFRALAVLVLVGLIGYLGWSLAAQLRQRELAEAELAVLAATDGLTGLANRRTFDKSLEAAWRQSARDGTAVSLLLIDIDHFKAFNDTYGHQAGDECLQAVARVLSESVKRLGGLAARYGGEELAVLLPAADSNEASSIAEFIRLRVEALAVRHEASAPLNVLTISIGSATLTPATEPYWATSEKLVALADRALYRAKLDGRNRTSVYEAA